jgi:hypothetical protein
MAPRCCFRVADSESPNGAGPLRPMVPPRRNMMRTAENNLKGESRLVFFCFIIIMYSGLAQGRWDGILVQRSG